jgi:hypothetical protein
MVHYVEHGMPDNGLKLVLIPEDVPILFISSLGHLDPRRTAFWLLLSIMIIGGLGFYDVWRNDMAYAFMINDVGELKKALNALFSGAT